MDRPARMKTTIGHGARCERGNGAGRARVDRLRKTWRGCNDRGDDGGQKCSLHCDAPFQERLEPIWGESDTAPCADAAMALTLLRSAVWAKLPAIEPQRMSSLYLFF